MQAANFLNIPALFELCCAIIASEFKGKNFDDVKSKFKLDDVVYTPEDEEKMKAEHEKNLIEIRTRQLEEQFLKL